MSFIILVLADAVLLSILVGIASPEAGRETAAWLLILAMMVGAVTVAFVLAGSLAGTEGVAVVAAIILVADVSGWLEGKG